MKTARWIGSMAIIVAAWSLAVADARSADAVPPPQSSPPDKTVSEDGGTKDSKAATPASTAKTAPAKPAKTVPKPDGDKDRDFTPSEQISEDMAVAYPSDI